MKFVETAAAQAYFNMHNERYQIIDIELADYIVVFDYEDNVCAIVKPVQLARPIAFSDEGIISHKEYEEVIDYLLDELEEVNMFFRFDLLHVFISKEHRALIRHHVNVIPYDEKEDE